MQGSKYNERPTEKLFCIIDEDRCEDIFPLIVQEGFARTLIIFIDTMYYIYGMYHSESLSCYALGCAY